MHIRKLDIDSNSVNKLRKFYLDNSSNPTIHPLINFGYSDQAIIEVLRDQITGIKSPHIKVAKHKIAMKFFSGMQVYSQTALKSLVGVNISTDEYQVYSYLREEILNNFGSYTFNSNFQNILENYGLSFKINRILFEAYGIIGTKLCQSIEKVSTIKGFFCDPTFKLNSFFLGLLASNCLLGAFMHSMDLTVLANYNDLHLHMIRQLEMIKVCYEHFGVTVSILSINTDVLPSVQALKTPFASIIETVPSVSEVVPFVLDYLHTNRLILKKIPFIGDLIFQVVDYYCRSSNFLNIAPFIERTVDLTIRYSLQIGHSFHMFLNVHHINADGLSASSGGDDGGDGGDKNPNFNRKIKVVALFGLIICVAKFFGSH
jgi:hypothetical protein